MNHDPKYADWHAIKARREDNAAMGGCDCCATVVGRTPAPRRYWWVTQTGHREGLCDGCYTIWSQNAADDPDLQPVSVTPA